MIVIGIDTETTGFSNADGIVQVGAAAFTTDAIKGDCIGKLSLLCDPGMPSHPKALEVHGITEKMVAGCPTPAKAIEHLLLWMGTLAGDREVSLVSHNAPFDRRFLQAACGSILWGQMHCTLKAAKTALPALDNHKLPTVAEACGVEIHDWHDACADAEAAARIAIHLAG